MNTMNRKRITMILVGLGLLLGSGGLGYQAAQADGVDVINYSFSGSTLSFANQPIEIRDNDGGVRGTGTFSAYATGDDNDRIHGGGELVLPEETIQMTFGHSGEVIYENGRPVGVELNVLATDNTVSAIIGFLILSDGSYAKVVYNGAQRHTFEAVGEIQFVASP